METIKNRTIRYLGDLHAAESAVRDLLDNLAKDYEGPESLRILARGGVEDASQRLIEIDKMVVALGGQTSSLKDFTNSTLQLIADAMNAGHDKADKRTMDAIKAHAALHLLHASYVALQSFATSAGMPEAVQLAVQYKSECQEAAQNLIGPIEDCAKSVEMATR